MENQEHIYQVSGYFNQYYNRGNNYVNHIDENVCEECIEPENCCIDCKIHKINTILECGHGFHCYCCSKYLPPLFHCPKCNKQTVTTIYFQEEDF